MSNIPGTKRDSSTRRSILGWAGIGVALTAAYGTFAAFIARYLQPGKSQRSWLYVARSRQLPEGAARLFTTPSGASVNITRQGSTDSDLVALSSICPHLGCQVRWEGHNDRFFCPCHNGIFDSAGIATGGPPADAGQSLLQYPLKTEDGMIFIELPSAEVAMGPGKLELPQVSDPFSTNGCTPCNAPGRSGGDRA